MDTIIRRFTIALLAVLVTAGAAFGQQVRHYRTDVRPVPADTSYLMREHILVNSNGEMAYVIEMGGKKGPEFYTLVSGPRTLTDVDDEGNAAMCFTVNHQEESDGQIERDFRGKRMCVVWLAGEDTVFITDGPFGPILNPFPLNWCGEEHYIETPDPNLRGT